MLFFPPPRRLFPRVPSLVGLSVQWDKTNATKRITTKLGWTPLSFGKVRNKGTDSDQVFCGYFFLNNAWILMKKGVFQAYFMGLVSESEYYLMQILSVVDGLKRFVKILSNTLSHTGFSDSDWA